MTEHKSREYAPLDEKDRTWHLESEKMRPQNSIQQMEDKTHEECWVKISFKLVLYVRWHVLKRFPYKHTHALAHTHTPAHV